MAQKDDKGFSFRSLFFRETDTGTPGPGQTKGKISGSEKSASGMSTDFLAQDNVQDKTLIEDFVQRLRTHINQNNQPGFDFIEFTETLFEESQNPNAEVYKLVFRVAQKMDKSLTPERLLQSSNYYKELVRQTADAEVIKGETKKKNLLSEKEDEKTSLEKGLKDIRKKIDQLSSQIAEFQKQEILTRNQLSAVDQKYTSQFSDIETKISAITAAKEQVISSIVDIEAGIKTNL
jgi:hypothetical protein